MAADAFHIWMPRPLLRSIRWQPQPRVARDATAGSYEIFLTQAALRAAHEHVWFAEGGVEPFGFLVGDLCEDPETNRRYVIISGAVPCRLSFDEHGARQISAEADVALQLEVDRNRGVLVGWYHRHWKGPPSLSDADVATHEELFPEPWHTALLFVTDPEEPSGALFRRSTRGLDGTTPLPFFEMVGNESLMAKGVRRSWVDWRNVSTDDHILQETPSRPDVLIPPVEEAEPEAEEAYAAPDVAVDAAAEEDLVGALDLDLSAPEPADPVVDEVLEPEEDLVASLEIEPEPEEDLVGALDLDLSDPEPADPVVDEVIDREPLDEIELPPVPEFEDVTEPASETEPEAEPEPEFPIVADVPESLPELPSPVFEVEPMPGLSSSALPEPMSEPDVEPTFETPMAEAPAVGAPGDESDLLGGVLDELDGPEPEAESASLAPDAAPVGGADLPEGMLAALKEVLAEVSESESKTEDEAEEAPEPEQSSEPPPAFVADEKPKQASPILVDQKSNAEAVVQAPVKPAVKPDRPARTKPVPWKRYGAIGLVALVLIAVASSLFVLTQGTSADDAPGGTEGVTQPPVTVGDGQPTGADGAPDSPVAGDSASAPEGGGEQAPVTPQPAPAGQPEAITPEAFEDLRDALLAAISSFYGRAVALDNNQATCADLQAAFVAVEDSWITYNVEGKAQLGGRLTGEDATRDERLYAGVQDVEREFDRSGCERP